MFLQDKQNGTLIEIQDVKRLFNPNENTISGRNQSGEEEQDPMDYDKVGLAFPSGEDLPRCWIDVNYQVK
jgi:hypothetical protein